jgi:hypothetical protein
MSQALALREPAVALMRDVAQQLATLPPERYGEAMEFLSVMEKGVEGLRTTFGERVKEKVVAEGDKVTEKGTLEWSLNGYTIRATPTRTGVDPKKLEARLRGKGLKPDEHMTPTTTYKVSDVLLAALLATGKLTQQEVDDCRYELNYALRVERSE